MTSIHLPNAEVMVTDQHLRPQAGSPLPIVALDRVAFWAQVGLTEGCWLWRGTVSSRGYGRVGRRYVHRLVYEWEHGPIPEGLTIDHLCGVKVCVNPAHLEAVTAAENHRRWVEASKGACRHGHAKTPENVYVTRRGHRLCQECRRINQRRYTARKRGAL